MLHIPGSTVLIDLPHADSATLAFTWDTETSEVASGSVTTIADYIQSHDGQLGWNPRKSQEKLWWIVDLGQSVDDMLLSTEPKRTWLIVTETSPVPASVSMPLRLAAKVISLRLQSE